MMARNPAAYAAEPFGKATASQAPTAPRQLPVLVLALAFGLFAGIVGALVVPRRSRHAPESPRDALETPWPAT